MNFISCSRAAVAGPTVVVAGRRITPMTSALAAVAADIFQNQTSREEVIYVRDQHRRAGPPSAGSRSVTSAEFRALVSVTAAAAACSVTS